MSGILGPQHVFVKYPAVAMVWRPCSGSGVRFGSIRARPTRRPILLYASHVLCCSFTTLHLYIHTYIHTHTYHRREHSLCGFCGTSFWQRASPVQTCAKITAGEITGELFCAAEPWDNMGDPQTFVTFLLHFPLFAADG